eukprot:CAMPEP_0184712554 /NCGR_PEP_ID=MMETSP0314-20130426/3077_1 /TAXON_ID=38298 /ORGANISM="Rhodella maculata, Strain CCMP 736" /LENGTH=56 /DNA_ID=CAMNT_0027175023 /DNA_START=46 /DNA_END=216 /DNA_ORIENTATION=-
MKLIYAEAGGWGDLITDGASHRGDSHAFRGVRASGVVVDAIPRAFRASRKSQRSPP